MVFQAKRVRKSKSIARKLGVDNEGNELWSGPIKVGRVIPEKEGRFIIFPGRLATSLAGIAKTFATPIFR